MRHTYRPATDPLCCQQLRCSLGHRRDALRRMLENPNLLEHQSFTEMLRMVYPLAEELDLRQELQHLPKEDYEHLAEDVRRVYAELVLHWLEYMRHLKKESPYLLSLAMRMNPFDEDAPPVVTRGGRGDVTAAAQPPAC